MRAAARFVLLFSALQLLWLLVLVTLSGIALLVLAHVAPKASVSTLVIGFVRSLHSVVSVVLFLGVVTHAANRLRSTMTLRAFLTGSLATWAIGLAVVTGTLLSTWFAAGDAPVVLGGSLAVFHYAYAAALAFGLTYWHARLRIAWPPWAFDASAAGVLVLTVALGAFLGGEGADEAPLVPSLGLSPNHPLLRYWTLLVPFALAVVYALRARRSRHESEAP